MRAVRLNPNVSNALDRLAFTLQGLMSHDPDIYETARLAFDSAAEDALIAVRSNR